MNDFDLTFTVATPEQCSHDRYVIVVPDGVLQRRIAEVAITALVIEAPIQFIGLLHIIARDLFPQRAGQTRR